MSVATAEVSHYDAGLQQFVRALEAPLRARIQALESKQQDTLAGLATEQARCERLRRKLAVTLAGRLSAPRPAPKRPQLDVLVARSVLIGALAFSNWHEQRGLVSQAAGSPRKDSHRSSTSEYDALKASGGTVCCKQAAADVGSTAAAALAAAMSSSWQRTASDKNGASCVRAGADGGGVAADAGAGLPCRAGFEIAVQIGGQEPHNHLSDPSVREHVRRLTSTMQAVTTSAGRGLQRTESVTHPASISGAPPIPATALRSQRSGVSPFADAAFPGSLDAGLGASTTMMLRATESSYDSSRGGSPFRGAPGFAHTLGLHAGGSSSASVPGGPVGATAFAEAHALSVPGSGGARQNGAPLNLGDASPLVAVSPAATRAGGVGDGGELAGAEHTAALLAHEHTHIRLRWLSGCKPSNLLVVCKPSATVMPCFVECVLAALRLGMHVVVEPKAFSLLAMQLQRLAVATRAAAAADAAAASQSGAARLWDPFAESGGSPGAPGPWDAHRANSNTAGAALSGALLPHTSSGASREGLASLPYASQDNGALVGAAQVAETGVAPAEASLPPPPPPVRVPERDSLRAQRCRSWAGHDSKAETMTQRDIMDELSRAQPSATLVTERGSLTATRDAAHEASEMADALYEALRSRAAELCAELDADVAAAAVGVAAPEEWLAQVRVEERVLRLLGGRVLTWHVRAADGAAAMTTCPAPLATALDAAATLGGDGTLLWACKMAGTAPVPPIVPFAMGSLGFMTPFPADSIPHVLQAVSRGDVQMLLRHRLECSVVRARGAPLATETHLVLNDVSLHRGASPFLTNVEVYCDNTFVTSVQGDGLLVATPTGSTAYSLAAGGSMVHPSVPGMLFTPICPHSLSFRPLVFPDNVLLRCQIPEGVRNIEMRCSFDGSHHIALRPGDALLVQLCKQPVPTICDVDASHDWFSSVREGLYWNLRSMQGAREPRGGGVA